MERASFLLTDSAGIWYDMHERETQPEDRNIHSFLCLFSEKLIPKIIKDKLWNQYNGCHHAQLGEPGKPVPVNQYVQKLEEYQLRCLDEDGERMISNQIKKMKFVNSLISALKEKVRPLVDWGMHFDEIVSIAEKIQTTTKLSTPQQPLHKQEQLRQWSQGKPMQFQKSDYKLPPNMAAAQKKGPPHPVAKNSINFGHFSNAKKDNNKHKTFGQQTPERDQLAKEGKCFLCKKPDHMAKDCPTRKVSYSYQQVNRKPMYKVKTASL